MTAPFSPHPPPLVWFIVIGILSVPIAMPLGRRNDWLGWLALLWVAGFAIALCAILVFGIVSNVVAWYRTRPIDPDGAEGGLGYEGFFYELAWDHERFCLRTTAAEPVVQVPLSNLLDVIDTDALFLENEVAIRTPEQTVVFPESKAGHAKVIRLIRNVTQRDLHVRREVEARRNKFLRQGAAWLPGSLVIAGALVLVGIAMLPAKLPGFLIFLAVGLPYGYAWHWVFRRFAYAVAWLSAARALQSILACAAENGGRANPST